MDIKLKSYNWRFVRTTMMFLLCISMTTGALAGLVFMEEQMPEEEDFYQGNGSYGANLENVIWAKTYQESMFLHQDMQQKVRQMLYVLDYQQECGDGVNVSPKRLEMAIRDLFYESLYQDNAWQTWESTDEQRTVVVEDGEYVYPERRVYDYENPVVREKFKEEHAEEIERLKEQLAISNFRELQDVKKSLDAQGVSYYATDGTYTLTNLPEGTEGVDISQFSQQPAYLLYKNNELTKVPETATSGGKFNRHFDRMLKERLDEEYNQELKVYLAFDDHYLAKQSASYIVMRNHFLTCMPFIGGCLLVGFLSFIYLVVTTGRRDGEGQRKSYKIDQAFSEIYLLGIGACSIFVLMLMYNGLLTTMGYVYYGERYWGYPESSLIHQILALLSIAICISAALTLFLSLIRKIKNGSFRRDSIIYRMSGGVLKGGKAAYRAMVNGAKAFYHGGSLMRQVVLITLGLTLMASTVIFAPVAIVLVLIMAPKWIRRFQEIQEGVREVKAGNLTHQIAVEGDGPLDQLARDINEISQASKHAIHNELKSQRLKTDLISNVSHDLRTPLTSIITYVDLLKTEGLNSEHAPKYLDVLEQKSNRLYQLTEDLFEAAKASSGEVSVQFEKVDLLALINQGLGEMADRIRDSGLEFRVNAEEEKYFVYADGVLLWRVVENLLTNVLKYAQTGSRVYLDLKEKPEHRQTSSLVVLEIKNMSRTELNIDADELMERFKRGEESRTTEGSGLGLAIAKDLAALQRGKLEIVIDGDLFKAIVFLEKYREESGTAFDV